MNKPKHVTRSYAPAPSLPRMEREAARVSARLRRRGLCLMIERYCDNLGTCISLCPHPRPPSRYVVLARVKVGRYWRRALAEIEAAARRHRRRPLEPASDVPHIGTIKQRPDGSQYLDPPRKGGSCS